MKQQCQNIRACFDKGHLLYVVGPNFALQNFAAKGSTRRQTDRELSQWSMVTATEATSF